MVSRACELLHLTNQNFDCRFERRSSGFDYPAGRSLSLDFCWQRSICSGWKNLSRPWAECQWELVRMRIKCRRFQRLNFVVVRVQSSANVWILSLLFGKCVHESTLRAFFNMARASHADPETWTTQKALSNSRLSRLNYVATLLALTTLPSGKTGGLSGWWLWQAAA